MIHYVRLLENYDHRLLESNTEYLGLEEEIPPSPDPWNSTSQLGHA